MGQNLAKRAKWAKQGQMGSNREKRGQKGPYGAKLGQKGQMGQKRPNWVKWSDFMRLKNHF